MEFRINRVRINRAPPVALLWLLPLNQENILISSKLNLIEFFIKVMLTCTVMYSELNCALKILMIVFVCLYYLYFETLGIFLRLLPDREILQCAVYNLYAQKVSCLLTIVFCSNSRLCFATLLKNAFSIVFFSKFCWTHVHFWGY